MLQLCEFKKGQKTKPNTKVWALDNYGYYPPIPLFKSEFFLGQMVFSFEY